MVDFDATDQDQVLWRAVLEAEARFMQARSAFVTGAWDMTNVLTAALEKATERGTALRLILALPVRKREVFFDRLVELASVGHADIALVRESILSLPRDWVVARIEGVASPILERGGDEEYRRLLELYALLDAHLAHRLAEMAMKHDDEDVREAGQDFEAKMG